jgi:hypothetical protein
MTQPFDVAKMAAEFAQANAEKILIAAHAGMKNVTSQMKAHFRHTYTRYVERVLERYGRGKSFFVRSEAVPLYHFFVPLDLQTPIRHLSRPNATDLVTESPLSIISGTGGSGKSMMMRHLLVSCIEAGLRTPVFLELRQLNQTTDTCRQAILAVLRSFDLDVTDVFIEEALKSGQLYLLLDGFDEVERGAKERVAREIQHLAQSYPKTWMTLSSRPDSSLRGWDQFTEYVVSPLNLTSAITLVSRLPVDQNIKERFIQEMRTTLFEQHHSFLSNPLLLSIMLLTYGDVAHIPQKLSTFYSQAYEALFLRHDALKGGFQRERRSGLDIQDYGRAFSAFSLFSYDARQFAFGTEKALELIKIAKEAAMLEFDEQAFLDDAVQAICLLLEEGLELAFAHRSFQEYFAARFIQNSPADVKAKLVTRFIPTVESDSVMALLWEMDPYAVEKHYLLPKLAEIRAIMGVKRKVGLVHLKRYLQAAYSSFHYQMPTANHPEGISAHVRDETLSTAAYFAHRRYKDWPRLLSQAKEKRGARGSPILDAFIEEFGSAPYVSSTKLRLRGSFLRTLSEDGIVWGRAHLEAILEIEDEIRAKHEINRESLADLLASPSKPPHLAPARPKR